MLLHITVPLPQGTGLLHNKTQRPLGIKQWIQAHIVNNILQQMGLAHAGLGGHEAQMCEVDVKVVVRRLVVDVGPELVLLDFVLGRNLLL